MIQIKLMDTRVYRKSYHERVDRLMPLPRGYKTLVFATFPKEDGKLTKNIGKFAAQCSEDNQNELHKQHVFHLSLVGTTF